MATEPPTSSPPAQPPPPPLIAPPPQLPVSPPPPTPSDPPTTNSPPPPVVNPPPNDPPLPAPPGPPIDPPTSPPSPPNDPPHLESPPPPGPPRNSPPPPSPNPPTTSPPPPSTTTPFPPSTTTPPPPSNTTPSPPSSILLPPLAPPPTNSTSPSPTPPSNSPPGFSPPPTTLTPSPPSTLVPPPPNSRVPPNNTNTPNISQTTSGRENQIVFLVIGFVSVFLFLGALGTLACLWKKKKRGSGHNGGHIMPSNIVSTESDAGMLKVQISPPNNRSDSTNGIPFSPREAGGMGYSRSWFTYDELHQATNGFSAQNVLGEGGFGCVYKGSLTDGRLVAVKQLKIGGGQGEREFRAEVDIISRIHHRHLVSLVGYCISDDNRLLVYEYVANDTLYFHLHGEGRPGLDWVTRVKIAIGSARGLAYLHEDCHPRVIHRNIKSSNILLDDNFEARVADFGLAKLAIDANTHVTTRVMGTFGYMAPEYASSGKLTEKSDVYSFGVVLLELITGRKSVDTSQPVGEESLVEWARPLLSNALETEELETLADPKLHGDYVGGEMFRMIQAAAACVRHSSSKRPKMGQVVRAFDNMVASDLTNGMKVGESRIYNSAQQSAEIRLFQRMAFGSQEYSTDFFGQSSSGESDRINSQRN